MDKTLVACRFSKAAGTYSRDATIQHQIAEKMFGLLRESVPAASFQKVVEFGCGTGIYSRLLFNAYHPEQMWLNDISLRMLEQCADLTDKSIHFLPGDAECIPFPTSTELITSCSTLQWFESPEIFLIKCHEALCSKGYLAFSTFGKENMYEIGQLTGNGLKYHSRTDLEEMLRPMFRIVHSEEEIQTLKFGTPLEVLHHLKQTGVTGTGTYRWSPNRLHDFCDRYTRLFGNEHSVPLTYHPIYIIVQKRV